ncbi:MAG: hypothetical protein WCI87_07900, partial [Euryarchaeota archaeon]
SSLILSSTATAPATGKVKTTFKVYGKLTVNTTTNHKGIGNALLSLLKYNATSKKYDIILSTTKTNNTPGPSAPTPSP